MASRLSGVFRWFSSSAPEVKPSGAEIPLAQAEEGGANGISEEQNGERSPSYQSAMESTRVEDENIRSPSSPLVTVVKNKKKEKKSKKAKKSKTSTAVPELDETQYAETQDTAAGDMDLSAHMSKLGGIAAGLEEDTPASTKRSGRSLSKRDLKVLRENQQRGLVSDEDDAMVEARQNILKSPPKTNKRKRSGELISTPIEIQEVDEEDYEALLQSQLTPAKPLSLPAHLSPDVSNADTDGRSDQFEAAVPSTAQKRKGKKTKRSLSVSESEAGVVSKKKPKRSKGSGTGNSDIKAMLSSQPVAEVLGEFERDARNEFSAPGEPTSPSANTIEAVLPVNSASNKHGVLFSQKTSEVPKAKGGFTPINAQKGLEMEEMEQGVGPVVQLELHAEPAIQQEPRPKHSHKKKRHTLRERQPSQGQERDDGETIQPPPEKIARKKKSHKTVEPEVESESYANIQDEVVSDQREKTPHRKKINKIQDGETTLVESKLRRKKKSRKNIEFEPESENGSEYEHDPEADVTLDAKISPSKSSQRQKRRLPSNDAEDKATSPQKEQKKASTRGLQQSFKTSTDKVKGKMTPHDVELLNNAVSVYEDMYNKTHDELIAIVHDDATNNKQFWDHMEEAAPHLPRRKILAFVRRNYHNFYKGPWTEQDDEDLERVYNGAIENRTGQKVWLEIQNVLNRYTEDCRDRWRTYSSCKNRRTGLWSQEEEKNLRKIVEHCKGLSVEANRAAGKGSLVLAEVEPNWSVVAKMMNGTRTRLSCYNKWMNIQQREKEGRDPIAEAPVSSTPWRAIPALEDARNMSKDEKIAVLSYISTSGAATEGKIPWKVFTKNKPRAGKVLAYRTFLRGALNSVSDDEFPSMQEKITKLLDRFQSNKAVHIVYDELGIPKRKRKPRAKGSMLSKDTITSDDEANLTSEDELELPSSMRHRMKKNGESQETATDNSDGDVEEEIAEVFDKFKSSRKKSLEEGRETGMEVNPTGYEAQSSHLVNKMQRVKLAKGANSLPTADIEEIREDPVVLKHPSPAAEESSTEEVPAEESTVSAPEKKKKSKRTKERNVTSAMEQHSQDQDNAEQGPDDEAATPSEERRKARKAKKAKKLAHAAQGAEKQVGQDREALIDSNTPMKKRSKMPKTSLTQDEKKEAIVTHTSVADSRKSQKSKKASLLQELVAESDDNTAAVSDLMQVDTTGDIDAMDWDNTASDHESNIQALPAIEEHNTGSSAKNKSIPTEYLSGAFEEDEEMLEEQELLSEEAEDIQEEEQEEIASDGEDWRRMSANLIPRYQPEEEEPAEERSTEDLAEDQVYGGEEIAGDDEASSPVGSHGIGEASGRDQDDASDASEHDEIDDDTRDPEDALMGLQQPRESDDAIEDNEAQDSASYAYDREMSKASFDQESGEDNAGELSKDNVADNEGLDESHEITTFGFAQNSHLGSRREASPELEGTPREIRESSQVLESVPALKEKQKTRKRVFTAFEKDAGEEQSGSGQFELPKPRRKENKRRKRLSSIEDTSQPNYEDKSKAHHKNGKKRIDVSEAQEIWDSFQPEPKKTVNGDRLKAVRADRYTSPVPQKLKNSFVPDQAQGQDVDSGSDSSIPAVVLPKSKKTKANSRMKISGLG